MAASESNGGDEESESDGHALPPGGPPAPSFWPPRTLPPSDPPYEPRKPARRPLHPEYEEDDF
jgi:hypothetical protein